MKGLPPSHDEDGYRPLFRSRRRDQSRRTRRHMTHTLLTALVIGASGAGGWIWWRSRAAGPTTPEVVPASGATPAPLPTPTADPEAANLPGLDASDAFVRPLVSTLSSHPQLAAWMATDNLVHRFVLAVVDAAAGRSPGGPLAFLSPELSPI
jgi:hypothetical protein